MYLQKEQERLLLNLMINYGGTAITATGEELNYSDLATLGTTAASKVFTADANNLTTVSGAYNADVEDTLTDGATITWDVGRFSSC
jgi:hypothetical protein